ncbi:TetR/AcrR family transcriptional regulator [Sphingosinicella rhizophila]|uniref:TetR/AcrR family transcriptional regulator n=1 Tax=Sphingosinicella rhizophila TaxID=3050082 RepID=A0ABU3Q9Z2_9SPHN|nr:TetR/AcrR family transcriptional regulator [Sphingosinicella sp. GR2756]MDT9600217.1 TetR/AcrR family transcriptional regulator [Sphingosinicella sp. GR2756]
MGVNGRRLTRDDWVTVARKALVASGIDDVKVDVLARRLKVTRGSFYWHFKNRQDLLDALLEDWEVNNRREIAQIVARVADEASGLSEVFRIWYSEDPGYPSFDLAIRVWARKSRKVAKIVHQIDNQWIALFQSYFERSGMKPPESFVRARIIHFHQVGYYALGIAESIGDRLNLAPYYYEALLGTPPPEEMLNMLAAMSPAKAKAKAKPKAGAAAKPKPAGRAAAARKVATRKAAK